MARTQQVVVTVSDVFKTEELHQRLMTALAFPGFYGRNWDAFWDAITGLVEMPHTLRLEGWRALEAHLPRDARVLQQCLERMQQQYPALAARVEYV